MYLKLSIFHSKNEYLNLTCQPHTAFLLRMPVFSGYFGISGTRQKWCKNLNLARLPIPPYPHIKFFYASVLTRDSCGARNFFAPWSGAKFRPRRLFDRRFFRHRRRLVKNCLFRHTRILNFDLKIFTRRGRPRRSVSLNPHIKI